MALAVASMAAIVFVGAGVLFLSQIGAQGRAEANLIAQLDAAADAINASPSPPRIWYNTAQGSPSLSGLASFDLIVVDPSGHARRLPPPAPILPAGRPPRPPHGIDPKPITDLGLASDHEVFSRYLDGQTILITEPGSVSIVTGLRRTDSDHVTIPQGSTLAILATQGVTTIGNEVRVWFVLSAVVVFASGLVGAMLLSRRLVKPLLEIHRATSNIAAGDFDTRVDVTGANELADLGRAVNSMASELQRSRTAHQNFLMSVSHDLRSPLTAIAGYSEALADDTISNAELDPKHAAQIIADNVGHIERLADDLLDLAQLETNSFRLSLETVNICDAVAASELSATPNAEAKGINLVFKHVNGSSTEIYSEVDPDRFSQVVSNLLDNAIRFARSYVHISVSSDEHYSEVSVTDDGPGISAAELPRIFERMYRVTSAARIHGASSGLGLAIVDELTTAMGGSVVAESRPGVGTTFRVRFPLVSKDRREQAD